LTPLDVERCLERPAVSSSPPATAGRPTAALLSAGGRCSQRRGTP
jgi:hypothetical protein